VLQQADQGRFGKFIDGWSDFSAGLESAGGLSEGVTDWSFHVAPWRVLQEEQRFRDSPS
jgi:hypothetical protein